MISQRVVCHGGKICSNKLHLVAEPFVRPDYESVNQCRARRVDLSAEGGDCWACAIKCRLLLQKPAPSGAH